MPTETNGKPLIRFGPNFGRASDLPTPDQGVASHGLLAEGESADSLTIVPAPDVDAPEDMSHGVHAVTKKTDYWFDREVGTLEKQAVAWADAWADKGLPRHDVPRNEPLEPEQVLAKRCAQTFRDWQLRVRTKMQDAIERSSQQLGEHVATLRGRVARLEVVGHELGEREGKIEKLRREAEATNPEPVRYTAFVPARVLWVCAVLLAAVEFFANFPVFRLLLPLDADLASAAAAAMRDVDDASWFAGLEQFFRGLVWNVEAGVVAFVAVVMLVVLGKQVGKSLRPLVVLRTADYPLAARGVRAHRRQHAAVALVSLFGRVCVLSFLFQARGGIATVARSRVQQDSVALSNAQSKLAALDPRALSEREATLGQIQQLEEAVRVHEDAAAYAATVQLNNFPILLLNLGLVATAAMLGFGVAHADLDERTGEHPDLRVLRDRCNELRRELVTVDAEARAAVGQAHGAIGHVQHLLRSHPMRGWESKVKRLEGVLPLFRGENARRRGLDPANIRAFDDPPAIELPPVEEHTAFVEPTEFARLGSELDTLLVRLARLTPGPLASRVGAA